MKNLTRLLAIGLLYLPLTAVHAQPGGPGMMGGPSAAGPSLSGGMVKVFGDHTNFSANLELTGKDTSANENVILPGKVAFSSGKSSFAMNLTEAKGTGMPPDAGEQLKAMGMDRMTMISRPDKKVAYMVYPGMSAYVEMPIQDPDALKPPSDFKAETTPLGKDTINGIACVKSKMIVTDDKGSKHEYTVWNATELKDFPMKIETTQEGKNVTLIFKDVKLSKPAETQFDPPADCKRFGSMQAMMQEVMMKRFGGGPPGP